MTLLYPMYNDTDVETEFFKEKIRKKLFWKHFDNIKKVLVQT